MDINRPKDDSLPWIQFLSNFLGKLKHPSYVEEDALILALVRNISDELWVNATLSCCNWGLFTVLSFNLLGRNWQRPILITSLFQHSDDRQIYRNAHANQEWQLHVLWRTIQHVMFHGFSFPSDKIRTTKLGKCMFILGVTVYQCRCDKRRLSMRSKLTEEGCCLRLKVSLFRSQLAHGVVIGCVVNVQ